MKIYQVGGAIRDRLLNLPVKDRDWVVVGATREIMLEQGYTQVGKDFPVFLHPQSREEYALARTERKSAPGYGGFNFDTSADITLEEDLKRRDLTINAIAEDENGELIDPYNGQQDLADNILRHVSPAFVEDPLRVLRVARFAARFNFTVADETRELMGELSRSGELEHLTPERVWQEMEKALKADYPVRFFEELRSCGALKVLFPEIDELFGVPQPARYHPEIDCGVHVMLVLEQSARLSSDPLVRFAALCHDLGKANTPKDILPSHHGHELRGVKRLKKLCERFRIPKNYCEIASLTAQYHTHCHKVEELKPSTILKVLQAFDIYRRPERLEFFLLACIADARGRTGFEEDEYPQAARFRLAGDAAVSVNSADFVKQGFEGKALGEAIQKQRIHEITMVMNADQGCSRPY